MSTVSFRAILIREIEQAMRNEQERVGSEYTDGRLDAYAHILTLVKDEDL